MDVRLHYLYLVWCIVVIKGRAEVHYTTCPDTWTAFKGSCYLFPGGSSMTFHDAEHFCRQYGGHLVHVDTADENAFLKDHIRKGNGENYWMGLTDESVEGIWEWFDTHSKPTFTDWHPGEPSDSHHHEDCAHFYSRSDFDFGWNDSICDAKMEPLCEIRGEEPGEIIGK